MKPTHWNIAGQNREEDVELAEALGVPPIVAQMLGQRGVETVEQGERFLHPTQAVLSDPYLLTDMQVAVERLERARDKQECVHVFGDYDVDGISGTALLVRVLRRFGIEDCRYSVPSRFVEGYGLGPEKVEAFHREGVQLLVTVDNGISAREAAVKAREVGLDLIVTDHHQIEGDLPDALAVLNPKREGEESPIYDLCGAAVAFKLACALTGTQEELDLAALGSVADIVPLRGENRAIVAKGLQYASRYPRPGLRQLTKVAGVANGTLCSEDIAFALAPRINAVGRLGSAMKALELLLTDSEEEAKELAAALNRANDERRRIELDILTDAEEELAEVFTPKQRSIVLARAGWNPGVIGIVAARILNAYNRPVVLISVEDGEGRASARCGADFDMVGALGACQHLLRRFGGHKAAAGMALDETNVHEFAETFEAEAARRLPADEPVRVFDIDAIVALSELDAQLLNTLDYLQPFGHGNRSPLFCSKGVVPVAGSVRVLKERHLKLSVRQGGKVVNAIGFNMSEFADAVLASEKIDVAFTPKFNTWRGETTIQLMLKDIHVGQAV